MRIIRTFHPIGQGAFYTERFYDDQNKRQHTVVFDCGTSFGDITRSKELVKHTFDSDESIDYLFISHLDRDHISLVETLLSSVRCVREIVLPLVSEEDLIISMALNRITGYTYTSSYHFIRRMLLHLRGGNDNGDFTIRFIGAHEQQDNWGKSVLSLNGVELSLSKLSEWVYIPYNVENNTRKNKLKNKLADLLVDNDVLKEIGSLKAIISNSDEFFEKLKDAGFVGDIIKNKGALLAGLKKVYNSIDGTINDNSLQLYSGPRDADLAFGRIISRNWCKPFSTSRVACLYTGDCQFDIDAWSKMKYPKVWANVGTIQLPHHGSDLSFDISNNPINKRYMFVASCGNTNSFGHPSNRVLEYLSLCDSDFHIVTESHDSIYMQRIIC